jgi:hypothetical protein
MWMPSSVTAYQGTINGAWITELNAIVQAAEQSGGLSTFRFDTTRFLGGIGPTSSQSTYAIGGSYFERTAPNGGPTWKIIGPSASVGSQQYHQSVNATEWLGARPSGLHGEMALICEKGNDIQWTYATQDNCLFCHGYLHLNNIQHQALRTNVWPQQWHHPQAMFRLQQGTSVLGKVVEIDFQGDVRYYQIS